ncbi:hypothetical protein AB0K18_35960 [Nonomuraea sp. NPDC049421]|uniref:hypothetical protein n=1 Tax=Nonomuraea sp. NPDC049421 TaxID=3155275 RepID=UPI003414257E
MGLLHNSRYAVLVERAVAHAEGYRVNVNLDPATLRPSPFGHELRAAAEPLLRRTAAAC